MYTYELQHVKFLLKVLEFACALFGRKKKPLNVSHYSKSCQRKRCLQCDMFYYRNTYM